LPKSYKTTVHSFYLFLIVEFINTQKYVSNIFINGRTGMQLRKSNLQITMN